MKLARRVIFFIVLTFCQPSLAQKHLEGYYLFGRMVPHSSYTANLAAPVWGVQLDADWELTRQKRFESHLEGEPKVKSYLGGTVLYMNMGHQLTGSQFASGVSMATRFKFNDYLFFRARMAHGFSFLTKTYDSTLNPTNFAIGSSLNYLALITADIQFKVNKLAIVAGLNVTHASNGNLSKPNVGLNAVNAHVGLSYRMHEDGSRKNLYVPSTGYYAFPFAVGVKMARREKSLEYPRSSTIWVVDAMYRFQKTANSYWDIGMEWFADPNYHFNDDGTFTRVDGSQTQELAVRAGKVYLMGRLGMRLDAGMYIMKPRHSGKPSFYNAFGLDYRAGQHWVVRSRLKAHLHRADYMEFGVSYIWI